MILFSDYRNMSATRTFNYLTSIVKCYACGVIPKYIETWYLLLIRDKSAKILADFAG